MIQFDITTSSTTTQTPARTNAVLLIGPDSRAATALLAQLRRLVPHLELERLAGPLLAMGHLATQWQPRVLFTLIDRPEDFAQASLVLDAAEGLRELSPQSRRVLIVPTTLEPLAQQAVLRGFDEYLIHPLDDHDLNRLLAPKPASQAPTQAPPLPAVSSTAPANAMTPAATPEPASARSPVSATHQAIDARPDAALTAPAGLDLVGLSFDEDSASPTTGPRTAVNDDASLGDVDLLDQLLARGGNVRDMALRMIRIRPGLHEVGLANDQAAIPSNHAFVPVTLGSWHGGFLHAPSPATSALLESWAGWLARWLATEQRTRTLWDMAMRDELTCAWNRRYFNQFLATILHRAQTERSRVTLMVFDIDNFKHYNDRYGHPAGDEILRETARLMQSVVRPHDVVARIGGDEFAVIFWDATGPRKPNSQHPHDVRQAAKRFQAAIAQHRFPKLGAQAPGALTISGGLASFPWDGRTPEELIALADRMALQAKSEGKNALCFGPGAEAGRAT